MKFGNIELILGPMFSGKSTMLQKIIYNYQCIDRNTYCINHSFDNRYGMDCISTHCGNKIPAIMTNDLSSLDEKELEKADLIAINEGQFFNGLVDFCLKWRTKGKDIVICALDGDYKQEMFPEIISLLPKVDNYVKLKAKCVICKDGRDASFTMRKNKENKELIVVGNQDTYIPVCAKCLQFN
jgi:thymidine kinase